MVSTADCGSADPGSIPGRFPASSFKRLRHGTLTPAIPVQVRAGLLKIRPNLKQHLYSHVMYERIYQNCGGRLRTKPKGVGCVRLLFLNFPVRISDYGSYFLPLLLCGLRILPLPTLILPVLKDIELLHRQFEHNNKRIGLPIL